MQGEKKNLENINVNTYTKLHILTYVVISFLFHFILHLFRKYHQADLECENDANCPKDKTCINGHCIDGCSIPGACGVNALCHTVLHKLQCSCPQCHSGLPSVECKRIANCDPAGPSSRVICSTNKDCAANEACVERECVDPCLISAASSCEPLKRCETRNHKPICICKFGFYLTENGELSCAPELMECVADDECSSNFVCTKGKCHNPCVSETPLCDGNKTCAVINHKPVCLCMDDCNPSLSMCLRDAGCSPDTVCRNYECIDPCLNISCPQDTHCFVENHVPVCKFCAEGWRYDAKAGCVRSKKSCIALI